MKTWSIARDVMAALIHGPALESELPPTGPEAIHHLNKAWAGMGCGFHIVGRWVHVPTKWGRCKMRLYELRR